MSEMPINCVMCSTNKHPSLMSSSDTCQDCGDMNRHCKACGSNRLAKMWIDGSCLNCGVASVPDGAIVNVIRNDNANVKPQIIDHLANLGWILFAVSGLCGIMVIAQEMGAILGIALIVSGVFQLSIFLGFSAIIDQLYKINVNTSKPDKSDS
jgi:hypothetical protein